MKLPAKIRTKSDLRAVTRHAEDTAVLLRQPGHLPLSRGQRVIVAQLLEMLAAFGRRALPVEEVTTVMVPEELAGLDEYEQADLLGGAA